MDGAPEQRMLSASKTDESRPNTLGFHEDLEDNLQSAQDQFRIDSLVFKQMKETSTAAVDESIRFHLDNILDLGLKAMAVEDFAAMQNAWLDGHV